MFSFLLCYGDFEKFRKENILKNKYLESFSKEELIDLIELYSNNWLSVMDGVWFQSIENELGMAEAMKHNTNAVEKTVLPKLKRRKSKSF